MALKKLMKVLQSSLEKEMAIQPKTKLGMWIHNLKIKRIENRITDIKSELTNRKTKK
jgi:hypothetical protein